MINIRQPKKWIPLVGFVVGVLVIAGLATARSSLRPVDQPTEQQLETLHAKALKFAAANGENSPRAIHAVAGTRQSVVKGAMRGATVDSDEPVFLFQLEGEFIAHSASVPYGRDTPRGSYLLLVYGAETLELTGWAVSSSWTDLRQFGPVHTLKSSP